MKNKKSGSEERTETYTFTNAGQKYLQDKLDEMLASGELVINEYAQVDVPEEKE